MLTNEWSHRDDGQPPQVSVFRHPPNLYWIVNDHMFIYFSDTHRTMLHPYTGYRYTEGSAKGAEGGPSPASASRQLWAAGGHQA